MRSRSFSADANRRLRWPVTKPNSTRATPRGCGWIAAVLVILLAAPAQAEQQVRLHSGLVLRGSVLELATLNQHAFSAASAAGGEVRLLPIWMIDDGLRRVYVHKSGMVAEATPVEDLTQRLQFWQPVASGGRTVGGIGPLLGVSAFNNYGQRVVTLRGTEGNPISIIQGITEINARFAKVEGLRGNPTYQWDMRVATAAIPDDQLDRLFTRRIDQQDLTKRLEVVRFFIEAERFGEARAELERAIKDFPEEERLAPQLRVLAQRQGTQLLAEAKLRRDAGQYQLASEILSNFPLRDVTRVTGIEVQDAIDSIQNGVTEGQRLVAQLRRQIQTLGDAYPQGPLLALADEIEAALSPDTIGRLSDYSRLGGVDTLPLDNRVALAVGGWLLGSGSGMQNLVVASSLIDVRDRVAAFLASPDAEERAAILDQLRQVEGADASHVAKMLPLMPPPLPLPEAARGEQDPGLYHMTGEHSPNGRGEYLVHLPPEYNPLRPYPCIVALHPVGSPPEGQIDYWAGRLDSRSGSRLGQATRHGFVVVAPAWTRPGQRHYESTPREHAEVLAALRDAMRRVSIDADRVFLTGLGDGGSAAWDIALSHPDLWAGMINISGDPSPYVRFYSSNATYLPMRFVFGEISGSPPTLARIGDVLDRYMRPNHHAMVITYRGRGPEHFYEEIHHHFDWMRLPTLRRRPPPQTIDTVTMRRGDQFFWWLEMPTLLDNIVVDPFLWDQTDNRRPGKVAASIGEGNQIRISQGPSERFTVGLEPSMGLRMDEPIIVRYRSRTARVQFDGTLDHLLEDVRTRADRRRPFWTSVNLP